MLLARIFIRGLDPRSRSSPLDVGNPLLGSLPTTDFCRPVSTYGHTLECRYPRSHRNPEPLTGSVFLLRLRDVRLLRGEPCAASQVDSAGRRKPSCHRRGRSQEPIRADRAERRTRALRELPSSCPCRAPLCRQPVAAKDLESPPPRRTSPLLLRDSDAWLACWPRSSFPRPPAKENVFQKTKVPSAVSSSFWVREDRSPRPLGLGLLVTPPYFVVGFGPRSVVFSSSEWHCDRGAPAPFFTTSLAPKP